MDAERAGVFNGHWAAVLHLETGTPLSVEVRNASDDIHPRHLHRHSFELVQIAGRPTAGGTKHVVILAGYQVLAVDFVADNPGPTLLQLHMGFGFMVLFNYA